MRTILLNSTLRILAKGVAAAGGSLLLLLPVSVQACDDWVAKLVAVEGLVQKQRPQQHWQPVQYDNVICPGERLQVGANSRAALHLRNNTFTRVDADSIIHFPAQSTETRFWIELQQGVAHFISRIVHQFEVATPYVNAVVEGTEFIVSAQQQGAVSVLEGKVTAYNESGRASLEAGQQASAPSRQQPPERLNVPAATLVEWAIYYPPVLTLNELSGASTQEQAALQQALLALDNNRIDLALQALDPASASSALQLARAALLLQLGRMDEFQKINSAQLNATNAGLAHALQAVADVARNRLDTARHHADEAVSRAPEKAASWIALSYVQQGALQLDDAMASARKATRAQPDSVLARLRLSELYLAQGDVDAAHNTLATLPDSAGSHHAVPSAQGFVELFRLHPGKARQYFESALAQNSANPQNHLGLGLTLLREGKLEQGRQQIEYAVSLDPLRSVLRSYLGRAYFEEKRAGEAVKQWDLAKQFDPNDPTPYFYTGVHKLFANDPVGAIDELETSRELNDKRALYRSETLLQSDAASRSATLARAYNEVGYSRGVLLNGWDAVRRDPASAEGHRLLADHYAGDPRYETARVSELLQSQLWQPLSAYPLQPQLSEADISVVAGAGPQRPGLNEYHSLFTQDGAYGSVNGYGGSDGTWADDLVGSVLAGPIALSLGQYHFESDGWRENADQEQDVYSGLVQWQAAPSTQLQLEVRKLEWDRGDLTPRWEGKNTRYLYDNQERETQRISLTHFFNPRNAVAMFYSRQQFDNAQSQDVVGNVSEIQLDQDPETVEVQGVHLGKELRHVYGISRSRIDYGSSLDAGYSYVDETGLPTFITIDISAEEDLRQRQDDVYFYSYWNPAHFTTLQIGLAYSNMEAAGESVNRNVTTIEIPLIMFSETTEEISQADLDNSRDRWSPKFGVTFDLPANFSLRMAAFRTVSKTVAANQTLEPVTVAGFNQFYGDRDGLESRNGGLAIDYAADAGYTLGASFLRRLIEGTAIRDSVDTIETSSNEELGEVYAYIPVSRHVVLFTGYHHARLNSDQFSDAVDGISDARNQSIPLGIQLFADFPLSATLKTTYHQHRIGFNAGLEEQVYDENSAYVTDLTLKYILARRLGFVEAGILNASDEDTEIVQYKEGGESYLGFYPARMAYLRFNLNF